MKRIAIYITFAVLLISLGSMWFVLNTQWGLERAYELVRHSVPGKLSVHTLQGKLLGPISFSNISYINDEIDVKLEQLELDWKLARLFTGTLRITEVDAHGFTLQLADAPNQKKSEPPTNIVLPFSIDISHARLTQARILTEKQSPFLIKQVSLQAKANNKTVRFAHLSIETELFDLTTEGMLGLDIKSPLDLKTDWTIRYSHYPPLKGRGRFNGTLAKLTLEQTIQQPGLDITLHGNLSNVTTRLGWHLTLDVKELASHQLAASWPRLSTQGKLTSDGHLQAFTLSGNLVNSLPEQGSLQSNFEIHATPEVWHLTSFKARHTPTDGTLHAGGEWRPGPELGTLTLSGGWQQLVLPLSPGSKTHRYNSNTGNFTVSGGLTNYEFEVNTDLAGQQLPFMQLKLNGHGDQTQVKISDLTVLTLDGKVTGSALASWDPGINWEATVFAQEINPAIQWHDWPGRLNAELYVSRKKADNEALDVLDLKNLKGKLRGYPVNAHGLVSWSNKKINIKNVDLNIGDSSFQVSGLRNKNWNLQAKLSSPNVDNLWPYSRGKLNLQANVSGPRLTPHIIVKVNGEKLAFENYRIGELTGDFDIDLQSDEQFVTALTVNDISKGSRQWQTVVMRADGARTQHRINLELKQEADFIQVVVHGGLDKQQVWQGEVAQTTVNVKELGKWQQIRPAAFYLTNNTASLEPWCLTQLTAHICFQGERKQDIWNAGLDVKYFPLALLDNWTPPHLRLQGKGNIDATLHYIPGRKLFGDLLVSIPSGLRLEVAEKEQSLRFGPGQIQASLDKTGLDASIDLPAYELGKLALGINLPDWNALSGLQPRQPLTGHIKASLTSLAHLNGFFIDAPLLTGSLDTDLGLGGTIGAPHIIGKLSLNQASAEIPVLGIKLDDINLHAHSKTGKQIDYRFNARSGKTAPLTITGYTLLQKSDGWPSKVSIRGNNFELANLPDMKMYISPQLDVELQGRRIDLNGQVTLPQALFRPRTLPRALVSASQDVVFIDDTEPTLIEERWKTSSHVRVILGDDVYFDGFGLRGEISGNLLLIDKPGKLTTGQGEIRITEGTYKAYGQDARIRHGRLIFANTIIDNPAIDLEAVREVDTVTAGVRVGGTLKQPELSLFSEPAMSESDVASYFLLGRPMEATEDSEGQQLQRALLAARLAGGELLIDQTGVYSYIDEISFETDKTTEQTSLAVGKYLSPRLYVRYVTGVVESSNIVEVHYKLKKYLRIQAESGYRGSSSVAGADIYYSIEH